MVVALGVVIQLAHVACVMVLVEAVLVAVPVHWYQTLSYVATSPTHPASASPG